MVYETDIRHPLLYHSIRHGQGSAVDQTGIDLVAENVHHGEKSYIQRPHIRG